MASGLRRALKGNNPHLTPILTFSLGKGEGI
jgi:hypothetical protein